MSKSESALDRIVFENANPVISVNMVSKADWECSGPSYLHFKDIKSQDADLAEAIWHLADEKSHTQKYGDYEILNVERREIDSEEGFPDLEEKALKLPQFVEFQVTVFCD
jgi:hypothetical protein